VSRKFEPIYRAEARERKLAQLKQYRDTDRPSAGLSELDKGRRSENFKRAKLPLLKGRTRKRMAREIRI